MKISLCLLTLNEIKGCRHDVPLIKRDEFDEIFAIDGGSTDGTIEFLRKEGIVVYNQEKKGFNAAHIQAVNSCKSDAIIFFHPKATVPVSDTLKFRYYFERGYDLIVASRMMNGGRNEEDSKIFRPRKFFILFLALVSAVLWKRDGRIIWDVLHGFRGIRISAFKKINPLNEGLSIDIESVIRAYKKRIKRIEFPTLELKRVYGKTHFETLPTGIKLIRYFVGEIFRKN